LAGAGLDVALIARDEAKLLDVADAIRAQGRGTAVIPADVSQPAEAREAAASAETVLGSVDLLVNAAGVIEAETVAWEANPDQWWRTIEVNLRGPFLLAHALVPRMLARGGGRIIDLSSGAAWYEMATASAYNASKTALARFGGHLHDAGHADGLRVFELAPGVVATDMTAGMQMHEGRTEWTPVERTVELCLAIARGDLDACSGWSLRAGADTIESLQALAAATPLPIARRLRVLPASPTDPLAASFAR